MTFPLNRPTLAVSEVRASGGRVCVLGSAEMLSDEWCAKECNAAIGEALFRWAMHGDRGGRSAPGPIGMMKKMSIGAGAGATSEGSETGADVALLLASVATPSAAVAAEAALRAGAGGGAPIARLDAGGASDLLGGGANADDGELGYSVPDVEAVADKLRPCLSEPEALPRDFARLFNVTPFALDTSLVPAAVALFAELGVKNEPLSLIPPQFETPLPPLVPAVFAPAFREPPPPALELFDLDEAFASERARLAQLANKCADTDAEYFIKEAALILGITPKLHPSRTGPAHVLSFLLRAVAAYKCLNVNGDEALAAAPPPPEKGLNTISISAPVGEPGVGKAASSATSSLRLAAGASGLSAGGAAGFKSL